MQPAIALASQTAFLDKRSRHFASNRVLVITGFTLIYLVPTVYIAYHKLFWTDELFTLYLSRLGWHDLLQALQTGADQHPPSFYYATHFVTALLGTNPLTLRLPAVVGFWLSCVLLYEIVRKLLLPVWGVVAMFFPLTFATYYYASEARGYGLMLGFSTLALFSWIRATEEGRKRIFVFLLAASLALAVASHYYAVLPAIALCVAELVRSVARKRIDVIVWTALGGTAIPLLAFLPTIRRATTYSTHFWGHPLWPDIFRFYHRVDGYALVPVLAGIGVAWLLSAGVPTSGDPPTHRPALTAWTASAIVMYGLVPALGMVLAKFVTRGFTDRYVISAVVCMAILLCYSLFWVGRQRALVAEAVIVTCIVCFYLNARDLWSANSSLISNLDSAVNLLRGFGDRPTVVPDAELFHDLSFYAPGPLARRLAFLADRENAVKYLDQATIDTGLLALRPWFPLNTFPFGEYIDHHSSFLVVLDHNYEWNWLTYELPKLGGDVKFLQRTDNRLLFSVSGLSARTPPNGSRQMRSSPDFSLPPRFGQNGQSLCEYYMGSSYCPIGQPGRVSFR